MGHWFQSTVSGRTGVGAHSRYAVNVRQCPVAEPTFAGDSRSRLVMEYQKKYDNITVLCLPLVGLICRNAPLA